MGVYLRPPTLQNAGKSSLINAMRQAARLPKEKDVTTAPLPGTTLGEHRLFTEPLLSQLLVAGPLHALAPCVHEPILPWLASKPPCVPLLPDCRHAARGRPAARRLQDAGHPGRAARVPGKAVAPCPGRLRTCRRFVQCSSPPPCSDCASTPSQLQLARHLTADEMRMVLPRRALKPRTFRIGAGQVGLSLCGTRMSCFCACLSSSGVPARLPSQPHTPALLEPFFFRPS